MIKIVLSVVASALLLVSCAEPSYESICKENGKKRSCTEKERAMINSIHDIMRELVSFDVRDINTDNFLLSGSAAPSVFFFGESHTAIRGQIKNLAAINALAGGRNKILIEGADRRSSFDFDDCGRFLLYHLYVMQEYVKSSPVYEGSGAVKYERIHKLRQIYRNTKESYDMTGLNIGSLQCGYWDDAAGVSDALRRITYENSKRRNRSMTEAIHQSRKEGVEKVFVTAGFGHLPLGEKLIFSINNRGDDYKDIIDDTVRFYAKVKQERQKPVSARSLTIEENTGSTKVIYKYLNANNISYREYIHHFMY